MSDDFELARERDGVVSNELLLGQRRELIGLLEQAADGWIVFMDRCGQYLGKAAAGRPTKADIESSLVGGCGFASWREMIEADRSAGGLGWKWSAYKSWQRAYATLRKVDGLRDLSLEPSEINRKAAAMRKAELEPTTAAEWLECASKLKERAEATALEQLSAAKLDAAELRQQIVKLQAQIAQSALEAVEREKALTLTSVQANNAQNALQAVTDDLSKLRGRGLIDRILNR